MEKTAEPIFFLQNSVDRWPQNKLSDFAGWITLILGYG